LRQGLVADDGIVCRKVSVALATYRAVSSAAVTYCEEEGEGWTSSSLSTLIGFIRVPVDVPSRGEKGVCRRRMGIGRRE
jgi:hypothetical protein